MDVSKVIAYLPLIQQLTKYAFLLVCLLIFAPQIINLIDTTEQRLAAGGEVSIGPSGIKLGEAPKMPVSTSDRNRIANIEMSGTAPVRSGSGGFGVSITQGAPVKGMGVHSYVSFEDMYYLIHGAVKQGSDYSVKVSLGSIDPSLMEKVEKVVYRLHESFKDNVREVTDVESNFSLLFTAWGQFEIKADVYLKGHEKPMTLRRWLNF